MLIVDSEEIELGMENMHRQGKEEAQVKKIMIYFLECHVYIPWSYVFGNCMYFFYYYSYVLCIYACMHICIIYVCLHACNCDCLMNLFATSLRIKILRNGEDGMDLLSHRKRVIFFCLMDDFFRVLNGDPLTTITNAALPFETKDDQV